MGIVQICLIEAWQEESKPRPLGERLVQSTKIGKKENGMNGYSEVLKNLLKDDSGQDLIEYALVAALIGLGATAAMSGLATTIGNALTGVGTQLTNAV